MKITTAVLLMAIVLTDTPAIGQTHEGALCSGLVMKARESQTLTYEEMAYLQNWCTIKNPYVRDAAKQ